MCFNQTSTSKQLCFSQSSTSKLLCFNQSSTSKPLCFNQSPTSKLPCLNKSSTNETVCFNQSSTSKPLCVNQSSTNEPVCFDQSPVLKQRRENQPLNFRPCVTSGSYSSPACRSATSEQNAFCRRYGAVAIIYRWWTTTLFVRHRHFRLHPSPVVSLGGVIRSGRLVSGRLVSGRLVSGQAGLGVAKDASPALVHAASARAALVVLVTGSSVLAALSSQNKTKQNKNHFF